MRSRREIEVPGTLGHVFRYLKDFEHTDALEGLQARLGRALPTARA